MMLWHNENGAASFYLLYSQKYYNLGRGLTCCEDNFNCATHQAANKHIWKPLNPN